MGESAVLPDKRTDMDVVTPAPVEHREPAVPKQREKRFRANLRFNGLRYLTLGVALGLVWGAIRLAMLRGTGTPEGTFLLVLAGGLLAIAGKTAVDILHWAEVGRLANHVERVNAIQRVFERARRLRDQATIDWRRMHTVLVDNLSGQNQEIRLFHDHDETDRQGEKLLQKALSEEMWIRPDGVDAVRRFKRDIAALDYHAFSTEADFVAAFNAVMDRLRRDLALAAIGIPL